MASLAVSPMVPQANTAPSAPSGGNAPSIYGRGNADANAGGTYAPPGQFGLPGMGQPGAEPFGPGQPGSYNRPGASNGSMGPSGTNSTLPHGTMSTTPLPIGTTPMDPLLGTPMFPLPTLPTAPGYDFSLGQQADAGSSIGILPPLPPSRPRTPPTGAWKVANDVVDVLRGFYTSPYYLAKYGLSAIGDLDGAEYQYMTGGDPSDYLRRAQGNAQELGEGMPFHTPMMNFADSLADLSAGGFVPGIPAATNDPNINLQMGMEGNQRAGQIVPQYINEWKREPVKTFARDAIGTAMIAHGVFRGLSPASQARFIESARIGALARRAGLVPKPTLDPVGGVGGGSGGSIDGTLNTPVSVRGSVPGGSTPTPPSSIGSAIIRAATKKVKPLPPIDDLGQYNAQKGVHETVYQTRVKIDPNVPKGTPQRPDPYWSTDSSTFTEGTRTANGGIRNAPEFWKQWQEMRPETLSKTNLGRIRRLQENPISPSPRIDKTCIEHFPEQAKWKGKAIVHHHVDQGEHVIPVPKPTHDGPAGVWHYKP